jgi:hypothetical protein
LPEEQYPDSKDLTATAILDFNQSTVQEFAERVKPKDSSDRAFVQAAHRMISDSVHPIYTIDEFQPTSKTLQKKKGSCSQRMACLESVCRAKGIATRVHALWISGSFWYPRFRFVKAFIPSRILISWPQFYLDEEWTDFDEIYSPIMELVKDETMGFTNADETLFEAVEQTPVDFMGKSKLCKSNCASTVNLSKFVLADAGLFHTRDELYEQLGSFQHSLRGRVFEVIFGGRKSR